jgi:hypothetical protein
MSVGNFFKHLGQTSGKRIDGPDVEVLVCGVIEKKVEA